MFYKKLITKAFFILILFGFSQQTQAQVVFVDHTAVGAKTGLSWTDAYTTIQEALTSATYGTKIWVSKGTYITTTTGNRDLSFVINNGVELYGGFDGSEVVLEDRDIAANPTILSGDIGVVGDDVDNSHTIIYTYNATAATRIDGLTIANGNANQTTGQSLGVREKAGAGIYNNGSGNGSSSSPTIVNCIFMNNKAQTFGAAIYNDAFYFGTASPIVENCLFINNLSKTQGGAVFNNASESGTCNAQFINCDFTSNIADDGSDDGYGGAVYNNGFRGAVNPTFTNCVFNDNLANRNGGAVYNNGYDGIANPIFTNCTFSYNNSGAEGAGMYNAGNNGGQSNPEITKSNFIGNHAVLAGAGIFNTGVYGQSNPVVKYCTFAYNLTDTYGAAMYNLGKSGESSPTITNSLFYRNDAFSAGGIYNLGTVNGLSSPIITNCTFVYNNAVVGGAIYNNALDTDQTHTGVSAPIITNCIIWGNTSPNGHIFRNNNGQPFISHSLVDAADCAGLQSGINSMAGCGPGMIYNAPPQFTNPGADEYTLLETSPGVNTGNNNLSNDPFDVTCEARIQMGTVDMGAYESNFSLLPIELGAFTASAENNRVLLNWTTITETRNAGFVIERSIDGRNFDKIGNEVGAGNSNEKITYKHYDNAPFNGVNYYRLKQVDTNGEFSYSMVRSVQFKKSVEVSFFPNPVQESIQLFTDRTLESETDLMIYTLDGQLLLSKKIDLRNGVYHVEDPMVKSLPTGMYWIRLVSETINWSDQIVKE